MLVTKQKYAELCGVHIQTIYTRLVNGTDGLKATKRKLPDGSVEEYIDSAKFPPKRLRKTGGGKRPAHVEIR